MRIAALLLLALLLGGAPYAPTATGDSLYLRPGRMVEVGGHRMNIYCAGKGKPTVVFDSGLEDWAPAWDGIQPVISKTTRTCTYDRAGNGLSDAGPMPRTTARIVSELHELLRNAGERPPYILVGHSFGGINVRHYADTYPGQIAGLVLVDASDEHLAADLTGKDRRDNDTGILHAQQFLMHCMYAAEARFKHASPHLAHACPGTFFRGLPAPNDFPGALDATLFYEAQQPKQYAASASEFLNFTTAGARALVRHEFYGTRPVRILVAYHHGRSTPADERQWQAAHRKWLALSSDARYIAALKSGHYIQYDQPDLVVRAIRDEVSIYRKAPR